MPEKIDMDQIRRLALDRIEKSERNFKLSILVAAGVELLFFAGFILLADFSNRVHVLMLISSVAIYTILIFGLFALGAFINKGVFRILKAIELMGQTGGK